MSVILPCFLLAIVAQAQDWGDVFVPDPLTPGPWVHMSSGNIWPRPAQQQTQTEYFVLEPRTFEFRVSYWLLYSISKAFHVAVMYFSF